MRSLLDKLLRRQRFVATTDELDSEGNLLLSIACGYLKRDRSIVLQHYYQIPHPGSPHNLELPPGYSIKHHHLPDLTVWIKPKT